MVKNPPATVGDIRNCLEDPLEGGVATHYSILAWRIHGQRSLVGYSLWGHTASDMTEVTEHTHVFAVEL